MVPSNFGGAGKKKKKKKGVRGWLTNSFASNEKTGRQLFFGSVIHLPVLLALMMVHKTYNNKTTDDDQEDVAANQVQGNDTTQPLLA